MSAGDAPSDHALRRICEGATTSVAGGLILWLVTSSMSQPAASQRNAPASAPAVQAPATPGSPSGQPLLAEAPLPGVDQLPAGPAASPAPPLAAPLVAPLTPPGQEPAAPATPTPAAPTPVPKSLVVTPYSIPVGSVLFFENFAGYGEGATTSWGSGTFVKTGLDHRKWLVSNIEGTHPVGCRVRLPNEFYLECRYSADAPEVTRGLLGWWKEPISSDISLVNDQGVRYTIHWVIKYGNDPTKLGPIGSSSLLVRKYYHTIRLPDGATSEVGVAQPTGVLRIERDKNAVKVFIDGQSVVAGTLTTPNPLVGFELSLVKAKSGALFFTEFKIGR
ncbi:MAG: hypothetical protein ABFC96_08085 [Thermoguttaceae bacterium]